MTTYTTIANREVDQDSPITASLMERLRDNPIAITEGSSGAPQVQTAAIADAAVTAAKLGTGVGFWTLHESYQPVTDVATIEWTGLSAYSRIVIVGALSLDAAGYITIQARTSAGTWRTLGANGVSSAAADDCYFFRAEVSNLDAASEKTFAVFTATDTTTFDSSNSIDDEYTTIRDAIGWASYDEIWDEVKVQAAGGNINGATADLRGRVLIYGMTA